MRHPFANVQYFRSSLSSDTLSWTRTTDQERPQEVVSSGHPLTKQLTLPSPTRPSHQHHPPSPHAHAHTHQTSDQSGHDLHPIPIPKPYPSPTPSSSSTPGFFRPRGLPHISVPKIRVPRISVPPLTISTITHSDETPSYFSAKASPGHFVKHSSKITLLLSGQDDGVSEPVYNDGSTIDGILAIPRPSGLLTLEVKVEGLVKLKEVAAGGSFQAEIISETLYTWDSQRDASFPSKITFRYTLPTHYTNQTTGERFRLPPTYEAQLQGFPGFNVEVTYGITVHLTRIRDRSDWWRKGCRLRVPFRYRELSRPSRPGPFPLSMTKTPTSPKTLFVFALRGRRRNTSNLEVHLYLPSSRVCPHKEPIPFFVTLFGDEAALEPFSAYQPSPPSFHPLSETFSGGSLPQQLMHRSSMSHSPIRVQLQRRTAVDAIAGGMPVAKEKSHMMASKTISHGIVHSSSRNINSLTWSGVIEIPSSLGCGGFIASGLKVMDCIVLSINPPDPARSLYMMFSEAVTLRLTTETYDYYPANITVSDFE